MEPRIPVSHSGSSGKFFPEAAGKINKNRIKKARRALTEPCGKPRDFRDQLFASSLPVLTK
jgi:hypothetical protein